METEEFIFLKVDCKHIIDVNIKGEIGLFLFVPKILIF